MEPGVEVVEVETEKITGEIETFETGVLRRVAAVAARAAAARAVFSKPMFA